VEPRDIIPDKQIYHVGDVMKPTVKMFCGCCFDPGFVDWAVYISKDNQNWTQTCSMHNTGGCGFASGYTYFDACGPNGIPVTTDMIGTIYVGVVNCIWPCAQTIDSSVDTTAIIASYPVTVKAPYPTGYGGLTIVSQPSGASVWIDGAYVGVTPLNDYVAIMGSHSISVIYTGYADQSDTVTIPNGGQVVKSYKLSSGSPWDVVVNYAPWIIGGAGGVIALFLLMKARQKKLERLR